MNDITIVTAFFDIGREKFKGYERGNNKYINYFKFWARINNNIIIYTNANFEKEIKQIREDFGLLEKTKIVIVDNYTNFDKNLYKKITDVMNNEISLNFHKDIKKPESWSADYNFIMMLKSYCIVDAIEKGYAKGTIAWLDFGFNHGGKDGLINEEEFNFKWEYNFPKKINLFSHQKIDDNIPIFDIVRSMDVYIRGNIIVAPDYLWQNFLYLAKKSMNSLLDCGLCDDDQTICLMAYRSQKDIFFIHDVENWYDGLKCFGGNHLTVKSEKKQENKSYIKYKERARLFMLDGKCKLAFTYYKQYLKEKIQIKLFNK
ncbi:protein YibB [Megamonas hypermegale]|uniref:Protein YibB n=1 Tax=Megamonas hypermegale TaxID=158847 RepID=A0A239T9H7_9FIRM|nr:WlaTC/HtrL family glycosyltransferase [Megamonas hypermegale]SNU93698.1 protein YibB [Megamonas hypermegale]